MSTSTGRVLSFKAPTLPKLPRPTLEPARRTHRAIARQWGAFKEHVRHTAQAERSVRSLLDACAPEWAELTAGAFVVDGVWTRTLHFRPSPPPDQITFPGWVAPLLHQTDGDVSLALHVTPLSDREAKKLVRDQRVLRVSDVADRAAQGYLSDPEDEAALGSAEGVARAMTNDGERLFTVGAAVTLRAGSEDELKVLEGRVRERLDRVKIRPYGMRWRHFDGFRAAGVPYATDTLGMRTPLDTQTLARSFPWLANPISTPTGPVWGLSLDDHAPVRFDPWSDAPEDGLPGSPAAHLVIIAPTGSGKTVTDGMLLMRWVTIEDAPDLILIDPVKGDYRTMVQAMGGQIVRMSTDPDVVINPFDLGSATVVSGTGHVSERNPVLSQARLAVGLLALMVKDEGEKMTKDERTAAETAILGAYARKGIFPKRPATWLLGPSAMPVLADVRAELEHMGKEEGDPEAVHLARGLRRYTTGSLAGLFNRPTNLRLDARVTSFDLEGIDSELRQLAVWLVGNHVWKLAKADRRRRIFSMDEVPSLLAYEESALLVAELYTLGRAYGLSVWSMSQGPEDYTRTHQGRRALDNAHTKLLLHLTKGALRAKEHFDLSDAEAAWLEKCGRGRGLLMTQRGNVRLDVVPSPLELELMGGAPTARSETSGV
jgi:conjugal transfer ATP-binding protein TraC